MRSPDSLAASGSPATVRRDRPLVASLAQVRGATGWLQVLDAVPTGGGWTSFAAMLDDPALLDAWVQDVTASLADYEGEPPPPATPASYVMGWYLQVPATVGALLLHRTRRVPDLDPGDLTVHRSAFGYVDAVALTGRRFSCLPGDPDAGHDDAVVVADERELGAVLRRNVVDHARAFHEAFRPQVKIGTRQRWGMVHDMLDTALWQAGQSAHDEASGVRDAALVLDAPHPPLPGASRLRPVPGPSGTTWTRRRLSCCFMFALPSAQVCSTCPRLTD